MRFRVTMLDGKGGIREIDKFNQQALRVSTQLCTLYSTLSIETPIAIECELQSPQP
jgi:hypothetical protein